jgi:capsular exopolysaccharide synthesis family protein
LRRLVDARRYLSSARRWLPLLLVGTVMGGVIAFAFLSVQPSSYQAAATLKLGQSLSGSPIMLTAVSDRLLTEYAYRSTTRATLEAIALELGLSTPATELQQQVTADVEPGSTLLTITAVAGSREAAADIANAVGQHVVDASQSSQEAGAIQTSLLEDIAAIRAEVDETRAEIAELAAGRSPTAAQVERLAELQDRLLALVAAHGDILDRYLATGAHSLTFVSPAAPPVSATEPRTLLLTALAAALGLLIAVGIAVVLEYFDDVLRDPRDLEEATGLPVLGTLEEYSGDLKLGGDNRLVTVRNPRSTPAEGYRRLRANLELSAPDRRVRSLLVTGVEPESGVAAVAANLAVAFAEAGRRTVLVDANLREPSLHAMFRIPNERGLSTLLAFPGMASEQVVARVAVPNLIVVASGTLPSNPTKELGSPRLGSIISDFAGKNDVVIVSSPATPEFSDGLVLSAELQHTLLVVSMGHARRESVRLALDALSIARASVIGTVFYTLRSGAGASTAPTPTPAPAAESLVQTRAGEDKLGRTRSA